MGCLKKLYTAPTEEAAFAALFVIQAILFFYFGIIKRKLKVNYVNNIKGLTAIILFLYALIFYLNRKNIKDC